MSTHPATTKWIKDRKAKHICLGCAEPALPNRLYCHSCANSNRARAQQTRANVRSQVLAHYGNKCSHCGIDDPDVLTIDHIHNNGNTHRLSNGMRVTGYKLAAEIIRASYPNTYQILCFNCNYKKHLHGGKL